MLDTTPSNTIWKLQNSFCSHRSPYATLKFPNWTTPAGAWYHRPMAKKKKKPQLSKRQQRKIRTQQLIFGAVAVILIASMVVTLFT